MSPADTPAVAPAAPAPASTPQRRAAPKSARRRAREFALQGLYQWLVAGAPVREVEAHVAQLEHFDKCDRAHFDALLHGCIEESAALDAVLARHVDRKTSMLSPVEHAALLIGCFELSRCAEIPYRVAINEAVELAKAFGGTDGHKYVNGVLDKCAGQLRPDEAAAGRGRRAG
ncbi:MAG: transcription antitermination factor NusB [Burkholderiaceae bacterium]|nr:transcription antitermination factor NusB [Burkholderiaceae bacterium]